MSDINNTFDDIVNQSHFESMKIAIIAKEEYNTLFNIYVNLYTSGDEKGGKNVVFKESNDFFEMFSKIKFPERGSKVTIYFNEDSYVLVHLRTIMAKWSNVKEIGFNYNGPCLRYKELNIWNGKWAIRIDELVISTNTSFDSVITCGNKNDYMLQNPKLFSFYTSSEYGNFNVNLWDEFLKMNTFNKFRFECKERISGEKLFCFMKMIRNKVLLGKLKGFSLFLDATEFSISEFNEFNKQIETIGCMYQTVAGKQEYSLSSLYFVKQQINGECVTNILFHITFKNIRSFF